MQQTGVAAQPVRECVASTERGVLHAVLAAGGTDAMARNRHSDAVRGHDGATADKLLAGLEVTAADGFAQASGDAVGRLLGYRDECRPTPALRLLVRNRRWLV